MIQTKPKEGQYTLETRQVYDYLKADKHLK